MSRVSVYRNLLYFALFLFFTIFFFLYAFPSERLTITANKQLRTLAGPGVSVTEASLSFPWSVRFSGIMAPVSGKAVEVGDAVVSPNLFAFISGNKGGKVRFKGSPGTARISLRTSGEGARVAANSLELDLAGLSSFLELPVKLDGIVNGDLVVETSDLSTNVWSGEGAFHGKTITLNGPLLETFGLAPFNLSGLKLFYTIQDNVLTLGENRIQGDIDVNVKGTVKLDPGNPESSRLDLVVELRPGEDTKEKLAPILTIIGGRPRPDGTVQLKIRGSVGRPAITS